MNYAYNKHTGEKIYIGRHGMFCFRQMGCKDLGDALAKGWTFGSEDYEEPKPKDIWWLDNEGFVNHASIIDEDCFERNKEFGNYFETEEEAELAVQKLKAWKRLKDAGIKFRRVVRYLKTDGGIEIRFPKSECWEDKQNQDDLNLLFGGKE